MVRSGRGLLKHAAVSEEISLIPKERERETGFFFTERDQVNEHPTFRRPHAAALKENEKQSDNTIKDFFGHVIYLSGGILRGISFFWVAR